MPAKKSKEGVEPIKKKNNDGIGSSATLKKLQKVLSECYILENKIKEIPLQIEEKKNNLNAKKTQYLSSIEKIKKANDYIQDNKARLEELVKKREESEEKLERVSTQREFDNENAIVEKCKHEEHQIRVNIGNLEKRRDAVLAKSKEIEDDISNIEKKINDEIDELEKENKRVNTEYKAVLEKKSKFTEKIDQALLFKFERIIKNKGGLASVSLKSGVCQGCHMQLPDEFVNTVRENNEIQFCPYCSRILVYEDSIDDEEIVESNMKYNDERQSFEDQRDLEEAERIDEIQEDNEADVKINVDDDLTEDDLDDIAAKESVAVSSLIADESEFDL